MSLFGLNDYTKAGPGVAKNAPKKKPFFEFFELYFRKFWKLLELNLLTALFCIPVVTIGPAIAGMTRVLRNYRLEKNAFIFHDFWKGFSGNLKQSVPIGLLDILFAVSAYAALQVYPAMYKSSGSIIYIILCVISISFALTLLMMNFYIFPMIVATDLSLANIIKNSFFLTCVGLKKNIITLLIAVFIVLLLGVMIVLHPLSVIIIPIWPISFLGFLIMFNSYPLIQKYVIDPYYEERGESNPEYAYLEPLDEEDAIFTDMGGKEAPVASSKEKSEGSKSKGNRKIS